MSAENNYWDQDLGVWIDPDTGNRMKPSEGYWTDPTGKFKFTSQGWKPNTGSAVANTSGATGGYSPQSGYGYDIIDRAQAGTESLENLSQKHKLELSNLDDSQKKYFTAMDSALKLKLQQGLISQEQYNQAKELAQRESEFARTLAQRTLENNQQNEISRATEMRQERQLQASLASNPSDWVGYEFYKRSLGTPQAVGAQAGANTAVGQSGAPGAPQTGTPQTATGTTTLNPAAPTTLGGGAYSAAPPAYDNESAQKIAASLFNPASGNSQWNPNLQGQGALGTTIEAPNTLTRGEVGGLSQSELGMLGGLLKAGINVGGKQIALDPADYFQQSQNSWVPTQDESTNKKTVYA